MALTHIFEERVWPILGCHTCSQIPTFRADPLHPECDGYCDFPVADRPNAVMQW